MAGHTPTPWEAQSAMDGEDGVGIIGLRTNDGVPYSSPTNGLVAWATLHPSEIDANDPARALANAAFIVKAVNSHQALVDALKEIVAVDDAYGLFTLRSQPNPEPLWVAMNYARMTLSHLDALNRHVGSAGKP